MSEASKSADSLSFQDILEKQGLNPNLGPEDVSIELVEFGGYTAPSFKRHNEWFAIPKEITAVNPLTGESEAGRLLPSGAFVGNSVELDTNPLHSSELGARTLIFGKSVVKEFCHIGESTVLNNVSIERGTVGKNTTIDSGTRIYGGNPSPRPKIGNNVTIGKNSYISFKSVIAEGVSIGSNVHITDSIIGPSATIESGDKSMKPHDFDRYRGERTFIGRSVVATGASIECNATVENSIVGEEAIVCTRAVLENTELDRLGVIREEKQRREPVENGNGRKEQEQRIVEYPDPNTYGHTTVRVSGELVSRGPLGYFRRASR